MSHPAFTPQPQRITALWPVLISCPVEGRRLSWHSGWLHTGAVCPPEDGHPSQYQPTDSAAVRDRTPGSRPLNRKPDAYTRLPSHPLSLGKFTMRCVTLFRIIRSASTSVSPGAISDSVSIHRTPKWTWSDWASTLRRRSGSQTRSSGTRNAPSFTASPSTIDWWEWQKAATSGTSASK